MSNTSDSKASSSISLPSMNSAMTRPGAVAFCIVFLLAFCTATLSAQNSGFLPNFGVVSTVPANGDVNPYGVAFVPPGVNSGMLHAGDILVSNFNNKANLQGTGTTIVQVPAATGQPTLFFSSGGSASTAIGLSTALHVMKEGIVIVGSFPSTDGTCGNATAGSILFINSSGQLVSAIDGQYVDGPWDSALIDNGPNSILFVANALNGTISRLTLVGGAVKGTTIGSGYMHQCDPVTFVDAPTGLVYNSKTDDLYVASTLDNKIFVLHHATTTTTDEGTGDVLYEDNTHLHGPLAMVMAPNGDLLVSNNDIVNPDPLHPSEIVEFTLAGKFVKQLNVNPAPGGAFGLNVQTVNNISTFAAVDDNTSTLLVWQLP